MQISGKTKISELIKHDKRVIDVLAKLDKKLSKLKNPILRKVMARRVNINEAASMINLDTELFFKALGELDFQYEKHESNKLDTEKIISPNEESLPEELKNLELITIDVRPILEKGVDPFEEIMSAIKVIEKGQGLEVINSFEPIPLINVLKSKGFGSHTLRNAPGEVKCYFYMVKNEDNSETEAFVLQNDPKAFQLAIDEFTGKTKEVDVRALEMPMPMAVILQEIEELKAGHALFVFHKKFPQFLLEELKQRGFSLISNEIDEINTNLIIFKK